MTLKELWLEAKKEGFTSLSNLIELIVIDKDVNVWDDDISVLNLYYLPKHHERVNALLIERIEGRKNNKIKA